MAAWLVVFVGLLGTSAVIAEEPEELPLVAIIVQPAQEAMGAPDHLQRPGTGKAPGWLYFFAETAALGMIVEGSNAFGYYGSDEHQVSESSRSSAQSFNFERSVQSAVASFEDSAQWHSISLITLDFGAPGSVGPRNVAERVFQQSHAQFAMLVRFDYLMAPGLDQVRLRARCMVYRDEPEKTHADRVVDRQYDYLSVSKGEIFRTWREGEKEQLIADIEERHATKLARYPHNKKAYDKDRRTALRALEGRETILPAMAMSEGWPGDALRQELQHATDLISDLMRQEIRTFAPREEKNAKRKKFLGIKDDGERKKMKGTKIASLKDHDIYRDKNGYTFILPR